MIKQIILIVVIYLVVYLASIQDVNSNSYDSVFSPDIDGTLFRENSAWYLLLQNENGEFDMAQINENSWQSYTPTSLNT